MKYLKLYENFEEKKLYWDIPDIASDDKKEEKLEQKYFDLIQKYLREGFSVERMGAGGWCSITYHVCNPDCKACKGLPGCHSEETDFYCDIFQMDDEYFDLEILPTLDKNWGKTIFNSYYFRCDGIEGLFQFLKDENIITENSFEN
jgi:hypothetical protein